MNRNLILLGSQTAKSGFANEKDIVEKLNNWKNDSDAQNWLISMNYQISEIENVLAILISGHHKADVQVQVTIFFKKTIGIENLSIKLVTNPSGFNQIDKRKVDKYVEMWNIPEKIATALKLFTGEIPPQNLNVRDKRRMFFNEMDDEIQKSIINFFETNKILIISDLLKGNDEFSASWLMVIWKTKNEKPEWIIRDINYVLNFFGAGNVEISKQGSLKIGKITMQRKGGDGGRETAKMLQFKINPILLFEKN